MWTKHGGPLHLVFRAGFGRGRRGGGPDPDRGALLIEAPTFDPAQRRDGDKVLAANPLRQVPALLTPGGEALSESAAILIWLAEQHPGAGLAPTTAASARR